MSFAKINCDPLLIEKIRANITGIRGVTINQIDEITSLTQQIIKAIYKYIGLINAVNFIKDNKSKLSRFNITAIYMGLQQQYNLFADDYYKQIISL
jgi:ribosome-interacting GTPase 1